MINQFKNKISEWQWIMRSERAFQWCKHHFSMTSRSRCTRKKFKSKILDYSYFVPASHTQLCVFQMLHWLACCKWILDPKLCVIGTSAKISPCNSASRLCFYGFGTISVQNIQTPKISADHPHKMGMWLQRGHSVIQASSFHLFIR